MYKEYLHTLESLLENIEKNQHDALEKGAQMLSRVLMDDGLIYLFGCGHSHMMAEEGFYRAGGLGAVYPVLQSDLMLHEGAVRSSSLERRSELVPEVFLRYPMTDKDALIVFSNSGINGFPVEMAAWRLKKACRRSASLLRLIRRKHPVIPWVCICRMSACMPSIRARLMVMRPILLRAHSCIWDRSLPFSAPIS